jgi:pantoate--beta-alanine ligase
VIKRLVRDLNFDVAIVVGPIVREDDGLALSSRNVYLAPAQRVEAPILFRALQRGHSMIRNGERNSSTVREALTSMISTESSGSVDYVSLADAEMLEEKESLSAGDEVLLSLAVRFGGTRLIDNLPFRV